MPAQVFHEQTHVFEFSLTHAALKQWKSVTCLCLVHMLEHFRFLFEKDVVYGASYLTIVYQGMCLHVFPPFKFHITVVAGHFSWPGATFLDVAFDGRTLFAQLPTFRAREICFLPLLVIC